MPQGFNTRSIHVGQTSDPTTGAVVPPIYLSSTFQQEVPGTPLNGFEYSRCDNPTRTSLQENLASLEGGLLAYSFASGMAAEDAFFRAVLKPGDHIVLSCKVSSVQDLIAVYRDLAGRCDYPLHLGLTEAGMGSKGIVASTAAMAVLLQQGIGDTIRVSLTPEPNGSRSLEVQVAQELLQTMGLRAFTPLVTACPGCGRTTSVFFQELASEVQTYVRDKMPAWREQYDGVENMTLAVMGCIVNGPGESKHANIGISLPGTGETPAAPVFEDGVKTVTLRGDNIAHEFKDIINRYVERTYQRKA